MKLRQAKKVWRNSYFIKDGKRLYCWQTVVNATKRLDPKADIDELNKQIDIKTSIGFLFADSNGFDLYNHEVAEWEIEQND